MPAVAPAVSARWTYRSARRGQMVRTAAGEVELLTPIGWQRCGPLLQRLVGVDGPALRTEKAELRRQLACCPIALQADAVKPSWRRRRWGLIAAINPPLASGAPRLITRADAPGGPQAYVLSKLGEHVTADRLAEAVAGMERSRDRLRSIEMRAQFYLQASGLTGTLVFATIGVLAGDKAAVHGTAQTVALVAVAVAAAALLTAGVHALAAVMRTFDQIAPNNVRRVRARTCEPEDVARRQLIAAVLIAQRRYSQVATWKLRRLKRATIAFLLGVLAVSIASSAVLAGAL